MVFVAVGRDGRPIPVPRWSPGDDEEEQLQREAVRHAEVRARIDSAMEGQSYTADGAAPSTTLRFLAAPTDVNWGGKVHGGIVMRWIDEAAHVLVTQWTGSGLNNAVYTGGVRFYQPLRIGDLVEVEARLIHTGSTSMHVSVHVRSGDPALAEPLRLTTHCLTVFVALDPDGHAIMAPPWVPVSDEDRALDRHAVELVGLRGSRPGTS
jgi:4-hydroxybenzoyl-CoA thioesterase